MRSSATAAKGRGSVHDTLTALRIEARWALADTLAMARRNLIRYVRSPELLVFSTINPVMFVLLFTYVFGGAIDVGPGNYIDFLLPGILVQTVVFGAVQTGVGLAEDLSSGMVDRYRSLPMARSAVMAGRILADTVRNVFVVLLMIGVGYAIGFRFNANAAAIIAVPIVLVIFGQAFSWISAAIGVSVRDAETAQVAGFIWIFPLTFMSSMFVPVHTMPGWLEAFASVNPITVTVDLLRGLSQGGEIMPSLWQAAAWTVGLVVLFSTVAITQYRRLS